ncbi:hypothetical protein HQ529_03545 [Candidatus Woesearchaeota archaeon]|nr:hypothetical protein [Candidatus Woesearchaeota archaeon]
MTIIDFNGIIEKVELEVIGTNEDGNKKVEKPRKFKLEGDNRTFGCWDTELFPLIANKKIVEGKADEVQKQMGDTTVTFRNVQEIQETTELKHPQEQETPQETEGLKSADMINYRDEVVNEGVQLTAKIHESLEGINYCNFTEEKAKQGLLSTLFIQIYQKNRL